MKTTENIINNVLKCGFAQLIIIVSFIISTPLVYAENSNKKQEINDSLLSEVKPFYNSMTGNEFLFTNKIEFSTEQNNLSFQEQVNALKSDEKILEEIEAVNRKLREEYLNRSEFYTEKPGEIKLGQLDTQFYTASTENMTLYGNFSTESFGIDKDFFRKNNDYVFEKLLKKTEYGTDYGYFIGSLTAKETTLRGNEHIQIKLSVPKGTKMIRVGSLLAPKFMLQRKSTFKYTAKKMNKDGETPYLDIEAELVDQSKLTNETDKVNQDLQSKIKNDYGVTHKLIKLEPLGLNAGMVLSQAEYVVTLFFKSLKDSAMWESISRDKSLYQWEELIFTNGWRVHTSFFVKELAEINSEEHEKVFRNKFKLDTIGKTVHGKGKSTSIISLSSLVYGTPEKENRVLEEFATTTIHEFFHHLIYVSEEFERNPLYKNSKIKFVSHMKELKSLEEKAVVKLLESSYAKKDWEEFICEAFSAKLHPNSSVREGFQTNAVRTNRFFDNLYDSTPPTTPKNLREVKIEGKYMEFTFDHSSDNVSVDRYKIYQNNQELFEEKTRKDNNRLSPKNPGEHEARMLILVENLSPATEYQFQISAIDEANNESSRSIPLKIKTKDTEPPKLQGSLRGKAVKSTVVRLNWPHPRDNVGVKEAKIRRTESSSRMKRDSGLLTDKIFTVSSDRNYFNDFTIEEGKIYTYSMIAVDEAGNESERSNSVIIQTDEKNDENKNEDKAENITSSNAKLNWSGMFEGIPMSGFQIFSWIKEAGGWAFTGITSVVGTATSTLVALTPGSEHMFTIIPIDKNGNPLDDGLDISLESIDKSSITTKDSTLYAGQKWNAENNFVAATDEDGRLVAFSDNRIAVNGANIDTTKPGVYKLKYSFKGKIKTTDATFIVTVKEIVPPQNLKAGELTAKSAILTWEAGFSAEVIAGYQIYQNGLLIHTAAKNTRTHRVMNLETAKKYKFTVKTKVGTEVSLPSNEVSIQTMELEPPKIKSINMSENVATLTWEAPKASGNITKYHLYVNNMKIRTVNSDTRTTIIRGLEPSTKYTITLTSENGSGEVSSGSIPFTVTTGLYSLGAITKAHETTTFIKGRLWYDDGIIFTKNVKESIGSTVMSYRVDYNGDSLTEKLDGTKKRASFETNGAQKINFLEYNNGHGLRLSNQGYLSIYAITKDGRECQVYTSRPYPGSNAIVSAHQNVSLIASTTHKDYYDGITFKRVRAAIGDNVVSYRVDYVGEGIRFNVTKKRNSFVLDGEQRLQFTDYNNGRGVKINPNGYLSIYAVTKNGAEHQVYFNPGW
ncbi:fibronectin type III domain-containing protein [Listeria rocourtiae]|uniref:fibronectin type III domain-containing protein n=1 Tax=Listeria rocourtiae TaxID=647910 RepID=UPI003D2F5CEF